MSLESLLRKRPPRSSLVQVDNFNVLVIGFKGCGKSSLINTLLSSLDPSEIVRKAEAMGDMAGHVTTELRVYPATGSHIYVWDTWGITVDNYRHNEMRLIIRGKVPHRWKIDDDVSALGPVPPPGFAVESDLATIAKRMHVVIIVVAMADLMVAADQEEMLRLRELIETLMDNDDVRPLLVLTRTDHVVPDVVGDPSLLSVRRCCELLSSLPHGLELPNCGDSALEQRLRASMPALTPPQEAALSVLRGVSTAHRVLGVNSAHIFPMINYPALPTLTKNARLEDAARRMLDCALQLATGFLENVIEAVADRPAPPPPAPPPAAAAAAAVDYAALSEDEFLDALERMGPDQQLDAWRALPAERAWALLLAFPRAEDRDEVFAVLTPAQQAHIRAQCDGTAAARRA